MSKFSACGGNAPIPPAGKTLHKLFDEDNKFASFDVQSLFTTVPHKRTINIILDKVYVKKSINNNLKKRTMKMLLLDFCIKTAFSFDNILHEKCNGV